MKRQFWMGMSLICLALSGCATRQLVATPLPESRVGVKSYAEMAYQPLALNDAKTIDFDTNTSPVARFPDGLGVYAAFSLDQQPVTSVLRVRTWFSSGWLPLATVLKPYVMFLDADKHVVSNVESFEGTNGSTFVEGGYRQAYFPVPAAARFFIVYSASSESDRMVLAAQTGKQWGIPNAYSGTVEVKQELAHP
ncbi:hypothetical protein [Paraburkholderia sp. J12]|uniref:hypothetical protein n=1 Tax=Paraburkholderia sp. J12 TaxID=2805432 RepID=UPI002ABD58A0|nr:hypothetical protein [Paraburkholderia sp. J12]